MSNRLPMEFRQRLARAKRLGHSTYLGRPCKYGHEGRRTLRGQCVECQKLSHKKHRVARSERAKAWRKENRERAMLNEARNRATAKGLDFNLALEDIKIPDVCPVLGIPMDQPSLDRWDNSLGYVRGNVFVISWRANQLKRDANLDEIARIHAYMSEKPKF